VYQLKNNSVTQEDLTDPSKAKLVFNCDLQNGIKRIINYEYDAITGGDIPKVKVDENDRSDKGIQSTFHFTQDEFASTADKKVINNKEYYFYCVAYGYNEYGKYKEDQPFTTVGAASSEGQKRPYLEGRKSKKAFGIPHNPAPEKNGSVMNSVYGYGPKITRVEGQGNGGNYLELTQASVDAILSSPTGRVDQITYENGRGPIQIKVVDPLNVPNSTFGLSFINRNYFYRGDTLASSPSLLNQYINSVIDADPCKTSSISVGSQSGPLPPHSSLSFPKMVHSSNIDGVVNQDTATWVLKDLVSQKKYYPCKSIKIAEEYYFSDLGLSVTIGGARDIAAVTKPYSTLSDKILKSDDIIGASISFANSTQTWLSGVPDVDGTNPFNWIRSGSYSDADAVYNDYETSNNSSSTTNNSIFVDEGQYFENLLGGTWAPYALVAPTKLTTAKH